MRAAGASGLGGADCQVITVLAEEVPGLGRPLAAWYKVAIPHAEQAYAEHPLFGERKK